MNPNQSGGKPATDGERRFNVTLDETRHHRVRLEAVRRRVTTKQLVALCVDHTLPLVEGGQLEIQKATASA